MDFRMMSQVVLKEYEQVFERVDQDSLSELIGSIKKHERIFLIGVGREGLVTKAFAMRLMHMGKEVHWIWDETTPNITTGDLVIATLGDGQIGHLNYVCERAKAAGGEIYVITGSPQGKTAKQVADKALFIPAAVYRGIDDVVSSIQPMGNLFEQCLLIILDVVVMMIVAETPELDFEKMALRHRNIE